ncbi:MAG: hypothetical protein V4666_01835 [Bacteroidota bacterium]
MKKYFILLFLFFSTVQIQAQEKTETPNTIESVSKKWVFFDIINTKLSKAEIAENKEMLEDTAIEFRKDMTFTFTFIVDLEGTWKLEDNIITTTDRRGKTTWTIHKITEKEITMSRNEAEQKIIFKAN